MRDIDRSQLLQRRSKKHVADPVFRGKNERTSLFYDYSNYLRFECSGDLIRSRRKVVSCSIFLCLNLGFSVAENNIATTVHNTCRRANRKVSIYLEKIELIGATVNSGHSYEFGSDDRLIRAHLPEQ